MKKVFLLAVLAIMSLNTLAQGLEIDEKDLVGTWKGSMIGSFGNVEAFNGITFREDGGGNLHLDPYGVKYFYLSFLSNENKLNLLFYNDDVKALKFQILQYTKGETMQLADLSGKNLLVLFKQETEGIRAHTYSPAQDSTKYNLQGVPVTSPRGVYIQSGKKQIAK